MTKPVAGDHHGKRSAFSFSLSYFSLPFDSNDQKSLRVVIVDVLQFSGKRKTGHRIDDPFSDGIMYRLELYECTVTP
jgi:hypothetical protein